MAANGGNGARATGPRCVALVGPFQSGKTTLLEAILARTGAIPRQGTRRSRQYGRRRQQRGAPSPHERRAHRRHHEFHGRRLHVPRLPGLGGIRPRHARGAAGDRCRGRRVRNGREENSAASAHPARAGRPENSAHPVRQQDRQGRCRRPRRAQTAAAGLAHQADLAADPDLLRRHHHRLCRSRARTRLCLQGACAVRSRAARRRRRRSGKDRALLDAGNARRSRRRADGAIARRHPAAARQGVRRSHPRIARGPGLSGADGHRGARQRRAAAAEGAAP